MFTRQFFLEIVKKYLSNNNFCFKVVKKRRTTMGEIICDVIIETGLILLLSLVILGNLLITSRHIMVMLAAFIFLSIIVITNNTRFLLTSLGQFSFSFIFMFVFSVVYNNGIRIYIAKDKLLSLPLAKLILFVIVLASITKFLIKRKLKILKNEILVPFICTVCLLSILGIGLHFSLSKIYHIDSKNLTDILSQVFQYTILFMTLTINIISQQQIKRISLYIIIIFCIPIFLKAISFFSH